MKSAHMIIGSTAPFLLALYLLGFTESATAQRTGQVVSVQYGVVTSGQRVDLQSSAVPAGAVVGGTLGLVSASGKGGGKQDAHECAEAKQALVDAETVDAANLAGVKVRLLCNS